MIRASLLVALATVALTGCRCGSHRAAPAARDDAAVAPAIDAGLVETGVMMLDLVTPDGGLTPDAARYHSYRAAMGLHGPRAGDYDHAAPQGFGYKMAWIAVPTPDAARVVQQLGLEPARPTPFSDAMDAAYDGEGTFITPTIDGWTLVVGSWVLEADLDKLATMLERLSAEHGEAQAFLTHRVFEYHGFLVAREGHLVRAHVYDGGGKGLVRDTGAHLPEEAGVPSPLDGPFMTPAGIVEDGKLPPGALHEGDVMIIAKALSVAPVDLDEHTPVQGQALLAPSLHLE